MVIDCMIKLQYLGLWNTILTSCAKYIGDVSGGLRRYFYQDITTSCAQYVMPSPIQFTHKEYNLDRVLEIFQLYFLVIVQLLQQQQHFQP